MSSAASVTTANKNAAARRVSIVAGQKPQLLKTQSATTASLVRKPVAPVQEKVKSEVVAAVPLPPPCEADSVRKEKEALERELLLLKSKAAESEERAGQLASHVLVLEDLLEQKKGQLDFIESRLESLGMDPVAVRPFEPDASGDRERELRRAAEEFDQRLQFLRQGVERRNELLQDSLRTLQHISEALEVLETQ